MGEKGKAVGKNTATMQILLSIGFPEILCSKSGKVQCCQLLGFEHSVTDMNSHFKIV